MSNLRGELIKLAHTKPELRAHLLPLLREAGWSMDERTYDPLKKGDRVMVDTQSRGPVILEVGRKSFSRKYDTYTKKLHFIDEETDKPRVKDRVSWNLFKRMSSRGEVFDVPKISLALGDMAVLVKDFRKIN